MRRSDDSRFRGDMACELVCVDPARVREFWPHVAPLIRRAMERGDIGAFKPVEDNVLGGHALLWLAWDPRSPPSRGPGAGGAIAAAAVTELQQSEWKKVCIIVACGGADLWDWIKLIISIETYARAEGCAAMRIMGRKGWTRVLPDYRPRAVILEKEL